MDLVRISRAVRPAAGVRRPLPAVGAIFGSSASAGEGSLGTFLGAFALPVFASWAGVLFSLLLTVGLRLDSRRLRQVDTDWTSTPLYALAGVIHGLGTTRLAVFAVSVPVIGYYLYQRHERDVTVG